ncbi:hypothetical protein K488DRAFT_85873 [Vararia minispora EC-137]|uniref:Uncharacterized protein n=1 Tax=Vararia minispora EC-137 TaxID=1314806 RepID=A0ACB8QL46_9AGAM|nr:hypothetical protein K488DRAFT_85873 [Vararia minispora EC-137]
MAQPILISNLSVETGLDVFLTIALLHILGMHRNHFSTRRDDFVGRLMVFFTTRGIVMTQSLPNCNDNNRAYGATDTVFTERQFTSAQFAVDSDSLVWTAMSIVASKVYALSVLVTLNNREHERRRTQQRGEDLHDGTISFRIPNLATPRVMCDMVSGPILENPPAPSPVDAAGQDAETAHLAFAPLSRKPESSFSTLASAPTEKDRCS